MHVVLLACNINQNLFGLFSFLDDSCARNSETNEEVAIKKIADAFNNRIDAKRTLREIKLLCHMDHDNVILVIAKFHQFIGVAYHLSYFLLLFQIDSFFQGIGSSSCLFPTFPVLQSCFLCSCLEGNSCWRGFFNGSC